MLNFEEDHTPDVFAQPAPFNDAPPAPSAQETHSSGLSGSNNLPVLALDDGAVISGSGAIVRWAREHPETAAP